MSRSPCLLSAGALLFGSMAAGALAAELPADSPSPTPAASSSPPAPGASQAVAGNAARPEPGTLDGFFNGALPDAIGRSRVNLDVRLRWEHADQAGLEASDAFTVRTRFGLTTAALYGFQGMIEGENVSVLGDLDNAYYPGEAPNGKTTVADPPTTEVNQAWLSYAPPGWHTTLKGGRQRLVLDNHRFVGDVGWRQNQQTFDAVTLQNTSVTNLSLGYSWLGRVNRVYGNVPRLAPGLKDFQSDSHAANVAWKACEAAKLVGYAYLLDLENGGGANNSCATYGLSLAGKVPVNGGWSVDYRGEFAWQTDYGSSALEYGAPYYNLEAGATVRPVMFGAGWEVLGSDDGVAVRTPLATLHAFNGWADVFLNTPSAGLQDYYAFAQVTLPAAIPLRFAYHKYEADAGPADFGQEFNVVASRKFGKHWGLLVKYAYYDGQDAPYPPAEPVDVHKVWAQLEFSL